jgi:hypothetical protein
MACAITALNSTTGCPDNEGGLQYSYACKLSDISAITVTSGVISGLTMTATGLFKKLVYDKDETSFFNQTGERTNETGALKYTQEAFIKFGGMSSAYKTWADDLSDCCNLVFIHVLTSGARVIQGIEIDAAAVGGFTGTKVRDNKVTPSQFSGTAAEEARLEVAIRARAKRLAPFTSLTDTAIEAL